MRERRRAARRRRWLGRRGRRSRRRARGLLVRDAVRGAGAGRGDDAAGVVRRGRRDGFEKRERERGVSTRVSRTRLALAERGVWVRDIRRRRTAQTRTRVGDAAREDFARARSRRRTRRSARVGRVRREETNGGWVRLRHVFRLRVRDFSASDERDRGGAVRGRGRGPDGAIRVRVGDVGASRRGRRGGGDPERFLRARLFRGRVRG